jgi:hypothetical protein
MQSARFWEKYVALGFSPRPLAMAIPAPNARPDGILSLARTFFAATRTSQGRRLLRSERDANLMIDAAGAKAP